MANTPFPATAFQGIAPNARPFTKAAGLLALAAAAAILGACATENKATTIACPRVLVDEDVGSLTRFREGPGRDITDIVARGEISRIAGNCEVHDDRVDVEFGIEVKAERGAAGQGTVSLPLFVAVVDKDGRIVDRQSFSETANFGGNRTQVALRDVFTIAIPRQPGEATDSHRIYVGFQLTHDEVTYNRQQLGR